ncbi:MAG: tol-pal system protein YbgF [Gammaproteobacteria bacterium]
MKVLLFLMLCASSTVFAQSMPLPPVVDHSTYPAGTAYAPKPSAASTLYEILGRMEQLQTELQQLRGTLEEQGYAITELKKRQNTIYSDLDQRLQALEGGSVPKEQPPVASQLDPEVSPQPQAQTPAAAPATLGAPETEKQRYQQAYETLKNGHYSQAITEFNRFLNDYPAGQYADNAQYWLGEAYKVNQEISSARDAFSKVVSNYPKSPKVQDALLKLGYIEFDQNNIAKAREYFKQITLNYPGTTAAHLASKKLQQMDNNP